MALKRLLAAIVDYAGLFPPAKLDLQTAMTNYDRACASQNAWMLGRFVLPVFQLQEFVALLPSFPCPDWSLSVLLTPNWEAEIAQIESFSHETIAIAALEIPPLPPLEIERLVLRVPIGVEAFFEVPLNADLTPYLRVLKQTGASAKIRTGGVTIEAFPSADQIAQGIVSFAAAQIPFKATAGLHHPLPAIHPATYEVDSPSVKMHGFLNVAIAAALIYEQKINLEAVLEVLQADSISDFQLTANGITWRDHFLNLATIEKARKQFFRSFGSCSFQEPIADLKELNLL
jgi:hypothetical protein